MCVPLAHARNDDKSVITLSAKLAQIDEAADTIDTMTMTSCNNIPFHALTPPVEPVELYGSLRPIGRGYRSPEPHFHA